MHLHTYKDAHTLNGWEVERQRDSQTGRENHSMSRSQLHNPPSSVSLTLPSHTEIWGHHSVVAVKCEEKGGDNVTGCTSVYLQTGTGSGKDRKKKTHQKDQPIASTFNANLTGVCACVDGVGWGVGRCFRRMLIENNTAITFPMEIFICHLQAVVTSLTFQSYKWVFYLRRMKCFEDTTFNQVINSRCLLKSENEILLTQLISAYCYLCTSKGITNCNSIVFICS